MRRAYVFVSRAGKEGCLKTLNSTLQLCFLCNNNYHLLKTSVPSPWPMPSYLSQLILTVSPWSYKLFPFYRFEKLKFEWLAYDHLQVTELGFRLGFVCIQSCACLMSRTYDQSGWYWPVDKKKGQLSPWGLGLNCSLTVQRLSVGSWAQGLNMKAYERAAQDI